MARSSHQEALLVAGGDADPNLRSVVAELVRRGLAHTTLFVGTAIHPTISWNIQKDELRIDDRWVNPAAVFLRYDVFTHLNDGRTQSAARAYPWFTVIAAWAAAHPAVRQFNSEHSAQLLKPLQLCLALQAGLEIPDTWITNDFRILDKLDVRRTAVKPVTGGDYCRLLGDVLPQTERRGHAAAAPAIIQELLVPPELRVYRVGKRFLSFSVTSDALDYRATQNCRVDAVPNRTELIRPLRALMNKMRLEFGAADFKTCPKTGRYQFLEVNSSPMFAAFDAVSDNAVSRAIVEHLRPRNS